jgi:hypothetical protein
MTLLTALYALVAAHELLRFRALPLVETHWKAASSAGRIGQKGLIAGLKSFLLLLAVAAIMFGLLAAVFGLLIWISPTVATSTLIGFLGAMADVDAWLSPIRATAGEAELVIALIGLLYFLTYAKEVLRREYQRQRNELEAKAKQGTLEDLPPTAEMKRQAAVLAAAGLVKSGPDGPERLEDEVYKLMMRDLVGSLSALDLDRRIDLTRTPICDENPRGVLPRLRLAVLSKGTLQSLRWLSTSLSYAATVAACILVVGVCAPIAPSLIGTPTLDSLFDLQLSDTPEHARQSLRRIARTAAAAGPPEIEQETESNAQAYKYVAQRFVLALANSEIWRDGIQRGPRASVPAGGSSIADDAVSKVEKWVKKVGAMSKRVHANVDTFWKSFGEPAVLSDVFSVVVADGDSAVLDAAIPDPTILLKSPRESFETAAEEVAQTALSAFLMRLNVGGELDAALSGVQAASPPPRKQVVDGPEKPAVNAEAPEPQPGIDPNNGKAQPPRAGVPRPTDWFADLLKRRIRAATEGRERIVP